MKTLLLSSLFASMLAACEEARPEPQEASAPKAPSALETAFTDVDLGRNLEGAIPVLEDAKAHAALSSARRDDVRIALAAAYRLKGDPERAITTLEDLLSSHGHDPWPRREEASRLLRSWLLGERPEPPRAPRTPRSPVAPVAHALAKVLPEPSSKGHREVHLLRVGRDDASLTRGTFNLRDALAIEAERACPLCEPPSVSFRSSHTSDWTGIVVERDTIASAVTVFYYDRQSGRIPARYDALLPMPTAEIEAHLEKGKGMYFVKQRPFAPPLILIAAPRQAHLPLVEERFAEQEALPDAPVEVDLPRGLLRDEITDGVHASFGKLRACYEALSAPKPEGKIDVFFAIDGRGHVTSAELTPATTLHHAALSSCALETFRGMKFPATGLQGETTIGYPIEFRN